MPRMKQIWSALLLGGLTLAPVAAQAGWLQASKDWTNNAALAQAAQVTDVSTSPTWTTGDQSLYAGAGVTVNGGTFYSTAQVNGGNDYDPTNDKITVRAFNAQTGGLYWESPALDCGNSVSYQSSSTPTIDPADGSLYIGTGASIQQLDAKNGKVLRSVKLNDTNTSSTGSQDIINSSPVVTGDMIFIELYGGFMPANKQTVALRKSDLTVAWFRNDKGVGQGTPCYVENGATRRLYTATGSGITCYNATDGAVIWTNATASTPWATTNDIWGSVTYDNGTIYAGTYAFDGSGEALAVDATTGALKWKKNLFAICVPALVLGDKVYLQGGKYQAGRLAELNIADGSTVYNVATGGNSFQTPMSAAGNKIYMTNEAKLLVVDAATGTFTSSAADGYNGGVAIDDRGGIYAHAGAALRAFGQTVPVTLGSFTAE